MATWRKAYAWSQARDDLKRILGQSVLKADGKLVFAESYVNKEQITRPAGQVLDFALRELIVARPHYQPPAGPEPDEEQECFGDNAVTFLKARGDFLKKHGPAYADARAVAWGLTGIGDFKNKGVAPVNDKEKPKDKAAQIADARRDNPWAVELRRRGRNASRSDQRQAIGKGQWPNADRHGRRGRRGSCGRQDNHGPAVAATRE